MEYKEEQSELLINYARVYSSINEKVPIFSSNKYNQCINVSCIHHFNTIEFEDAHFRLKSAVLLPEFKTDDTGSKISSSIDLVQQCLEFAADFSSKKIWITGHTDTSGSVDYNLKLSNLRASAIHAVLTGDRSQFASAANGPHIQDKSFFYPDQTDVLSWVFKKLGWPCDPKQHPTLSHAVLAFQKSYNDLGKAGNKAAATIQETAVFNLETWAAVFDCYEYNLSQSMFLGLSELKKFRQDIQLSDRILKDANGSNWGSCGESQPVEFLGQDGKRTQKNRRVEICFLDDCENFGIPCREGACQSEACRIFKDATIDKTTFSSNTPQLNIDLCLEDKDTNTKLANTPYILHLTNGEQINGETDSQGRIFYSNVEARNHCLEIAGTLTYIPPVEAGSEQLIWGVFEEKKERLTTKYK